MIQPKWQEEVLKDFLKFTNHQIPGSSYAILHHGKMVANGMLGFAQLENNLAVDKNSHFRIASMSKSVTCMAVMLLVARKQVILDAPAENYVAELADIHYLEAEAPRITVRDLMSHMAGFPEDNLWGDRHLDWQSVDLLNFLKGGIAFSNNPQTAFEYSNLAFGILGQLISNLVDSNYQSFINDNIFQALNMNGTYWEMDEVPAEQLVYGYRLVEGKFSREPMLHDGAFGAMGGLITTIGDFVKYVSFHLAAYSKEADANVISKSARREMHRPWSLENIMLTEEGALVRGYGYGLQYMQDNLGNKFIGHSGSLPGFNSHWMMLPQYGLAIITFANAKTPKMQLFNLRTIEKLISLPEFARDDEPVSAILQQRFDELLSFMPDYQDAVCAIEIFNETFWDDNIPELFVRETQAYFVLLGEKRKISAIRAENHLRGYFDISGNGHKLTVHLALTPEKNARIQEVSYQFQ